MKQPIALLLSLFFLAGCSFGEPPEPLTEPSATTAARTITPPSIPSTSAHAGTTVPLPEGLKTTTEGRFVWRNATVYYAMTDRFYNGDPTNDESYGRRRAEAAGSDLATFNGGDFKGLTQKIEEGYFTGLGINALWISAPYEQIHGFVAGGNGEFAHYAFHGYYPLDWTMTDRNFGTRAEFEALVDSAHAKGIRVILDVVLNHTGYHTVKDMQDYGFGAFKGIDGTWQPSSGQRFDAYHESIDYTDEDAWARWWGRQWVRSGLPGYRAGGTDDYTQTLAGLPDIITEEKGAVDLPPILRTKWAKEKGANFTAYELTRADVLRRRQELPPAGYIARWLTAWVEEFGIDGFRIDTAKHVEKEVWDDLKQSADKALKDWREDNPDKPGAAFSGDFFMVGEVWGQGIQRTDYFDHGFDALINFSFQGESFEGPAYRPQTMPSIYQRYADTLNKESTNFLTYISSHDTKLFDRPRLKDALTYQLLLPGALEVFYGDETARPYVSSGQDFSMGTRGFMNWDSIDPDIFQHFSKISSFRARNLAVGAGAHTQISEEPFVFQRDYEKGAVRNTVVVAMDQTKDAVLNVSKAFADDTLLRDAYTMTGYRVENGRIRLSPDPSGIVLLEKVE